MKIAHYILLILSFSTLVVTGCTDTVGDDAAELSAGCELVVTLAPGAPQTADDTSVDGDQPWGDPYPEEIGRPSESVVRSVTVYMVSNSGSMIPLVPVQSAMTGGKYQYRMKVSLNASYVDRDDDGSCSFSGKIVALANYPGASPSDPMVSAPFDIEAPDAGGLIPMWGVTTVSRLPLVADRTTDAGEIFLLRSLPKLSIMMADDLKDTYKIISVTPDVDGFNRLANCVPAGASTVSETKQLMMSACFNPENDATAGAPRFYGLGTESVWCYPAERACPSVDNRPMSFTVTLARKDGTAAPFTGKVYMCDYAGGSPQFATAFPSLVRNHDYQYRINLSELEFIISFQQWIFGGKVHLEFE